MVLHFFKIINLNWPTILLINIVNLKLILPLWTNFRAIEFTTLSLLPTAAADVEINVTSLHLCWVCLYEYGIAHVHRYLWFIIIRLSVKFTLKFSNSSSKELILVNLRIKPWLHRATFASFSPAMQSTTASGSPASRQLMLNNTLWTWLKSKRRS